MTPDELVALLQGEHMDQRLELEQGAHDAAGTERRAAALDTAVRDVTRAWVTAAGGTRTAIEDRSALARIIAMVADRVRGALDGFGSGARRGLANVSTAAQKLGVVQALAAWRGQGGGALRPRPPDAVPRELASDAASLPRQVAAIQRAALALLKPEALRSGGLMAALMPVAKARSAVDLVKAAVARYIGGAMATGQQAVTAAADAPFEVWTAERDACARCTAYSGELVATGAGFPGGRSLDPKQVKAKASPVRPPLHPHCRCDLVPYDPDLHPPGAVTLPEALKREAYRSAVRGFSLPTESNASRLRVAEHVLSLNPDLPKSVLAYGRSAVRQGRFPSGRDVPNPSP